MYWENMNWGMGIHVLRIYKGIPLHVYVLTIHVLKFGIHELRIPGTCILDTCIVDTCIYDTWSSLVAL